MQLHLSLAGVVVAILATLTMDLGAACSMTGPIPDTSRVFVDWKRARSLLRRDRPKYNFYAREATIFVAHW
jgi:hypothetical protein